MTDIEAKINSKLQEIESLFQDKNGNILPPPVIIKNSSALIQSGLNQMGTAEDPATTGGEEQKNQKKGLPAKNAPKNARGQSTSAQERKQEAISKVIRQNSTAGKRQQNESVTT